MWGYNAENNQQWQTGTRDAGFSITLVSKLSGNVPLTAPRTVSTAGQRAACAADL